MHFGSLRRTAPISRSFGYDRGPQSVARYYIDEFVRRWASDIHGRVLEIGDNRYTRRFGGDRVLQSDVLHVRSDNPAATIVADLTNAEHIRSNAFDCLGNVLAAIALLHGLASHELRKEQLDMQDPDYQVHRYSPSDKERVKACLLRGCQRVSERLFRITGREDRAAVWQAP